MCVLYSTVLYTTLAHVPSEDINLNYNIFLDGTVGHLFEMVQYRVFKMVINVI